MSSRRCQSSAGRKEEAEAVEATDTEEEEVDAKNRGASHAWTSKLRMEKPMITRTVPIASIQVKGMPWRIQSKSAEMGMARNPAMVTKSGSMKATPMVNSQLMAYAMSTLPAIHPHPAASVGTRNGSTP